MTSKLDILITNGRILDGSGNPAYEADIVIFDPETVIDNSTFDDPRQPPTGIHCVIVNGAPAVENGQVVGATSGQVLRRG